VLALFALLFTVCLACQSACSADDAKAQPVTAEAYLENVVKPALAAVKMDLVVVNAPVPARVVMKIIHEAGQRIFVDDSVTAFLHLELRVGFQQYGFQRIGGLWKLLPYPPTNETMELVNDMAQLPCLHIVWA
jgi:hypothetical protein